jgi:hypothetical protein
MSTMSNSTHKDSFLASEKTACSFSVKTNQKYKESKKYTHVFWRNAICGVHNVIEQTALVILCICHACRCVPYGSGCTCDIQNTSQLSSPTIHLGMFGEKTLIFQEIS